MTRREAFLTVRLTAKEQSAWKAKAKAKAAGRPPSELLREAMRRTRTWTAAAAGIERERARQVARIGNNLNQIARWANTHKEAAEATEVIAHLAAIEREIGSWRGGGRDRMHIKFLARGTGNAGKAAEYLLGERDSQGQPRC